jgi:hypothetical protein
MKTKALAIPLFLVLFALCGGAEAGNKKPLAELHRKYMHLFSTKPSVKDVVRDTLYLIGPKTEYKIGKGIAIKCENKSGKCVAIYTKVYESGGTADLPIVESWNEDGGSTIYHPQSVEMQPTQDGGMEVQMTF